MADPVGEGGVRNETGDAHISKNGSPVGVALKSKTWTMCGWPSSGARRRCPPSLNPDFIQFALLAPLPQTRLYVDLKEQGRILDEHARQTGPYAAGGPAADPFPDSLARESGRSRRSSTPPRSRPRLVRAPSLTSVQRLAFWACVETLTGAE
jgi:hypothetical protein